MHPLAWILWLTAGATATLLTRNPFYQVLLLAIFILVTDVERDVQREGTEGSALDRAMLGRALPISPLRLALFAIPAGAIFNLLTSHVGDTVLLRLPVQLPLVGGALTVEALVYGAINGLILVTLFAAFAVLSLAVSIRDLIAYIPRAFYPVAVVSAIAVTFVPNTVRQFQQVREAQAIRGHRMRGWRDWLPLFLPVLVGGLERALELAEAMTARGFGEQPEERRRAVGPALVIGLACILAAGVAQLMPTWVASAPFLLVAGTGLIGWTIWRAGRGVSHTRYRHHRWVGTDTAILIGCAVAVLPLLLWGETRVYSPYPRVTWPSFDLRVGGALLALMLPAMVRRLRSDGIGRSGPADGPAQSRERR